MTGRVLIACEESGAVRNAFAARGWDAWSCDLKPTSTPGQHLQCDVLTVLDRDWDLLIAHPPCTDLAVSGAKWFFAKVYEQRRAIEFARKFFDAKVKHICIENPVGVLSTAIRKPDQIIHPWEYGHPEEKTTCLWLKNLPLLAPTNILPLPACGHWENQTPSGQNAIGPCEERAELRSKTYLGIADAMAHQWLDFLYADKPKSPQLNTL